VIPLLLLPGMMCDARLFGPQIDALSGRLPILVCPLGGHDTIAAIASDILSYAPPVFSLAGLSMGGIVAMEMLRQAPDRVARLALMDTNPLAEEEAARARRGPQMVAARAGRLREIMRDEMKPNYLARTARRAAVLDLCMAMAMDLGPEVFLAQSVALRDRPDQCETLRLYGRPSLVLCGAEDTLCPVARHELMADLLQNAHLEIVAHAGHLPTLEQPKTTTAALCRWLEI